MSKARELSVLVDGVNLVDGDVGIGVDTPVSRLHVSDAVTSGGVDNVAIFQGGVLQVEGSGAGIFLTSSLGTSRGAQIAAINTTGAGQGHDLVFYTNGSSQSPSERMRIRAGGGLTFNGDTAAANALDDYEEGTFTPTFGGWNGLYSVQQGNYLKIGKLVFLNGQATTVPDASKSFVGTGGFMLFDTVPFVISQPTSQINGVWHLATASNTTASLFKFGFWDSNFPNNAVDGSAGTGRSNFAVGNLSPSTAVNLRFMFTYIAA